MKRGILFLALIMLIQLGYRIAPVLAQSNSDEAEIRKVIDNYFKGATKGDLDLIMSQISNNYFQIDKEGNAIDYARARSIVEELLKKFTNVSISDLKTVNLNVQNNKATITLEYNVSSFNRDFANNVTTKIEKSCTLAKENGFWKIINIGFPVPVLETEE